MAKDNKIKLKALLNEAFGTWGVVTHAHPNRKKLQEQEPGVPGVPTRPAAQPPSCLLYTSPSPRDRQKSRMPSSA